MTSDIEIELVVCGDSLPVCVGSLSVCVSWRGDGVAEVTASVTKAPGLCGAGAWSVP
jgi:hypothetical protein